MGPVDDHNPVSLARQNTSKRAPTTSPDIRKQHIHIYICMCIVYSNWFPVIGFQCGRITCRTSQKGGYFNRTNSSANHLICRTKSPNTVVLVKRVCERLTHAEPMVVFWTSKQIVKRAFRQFESADKSKLLLV